MSGELDWLLKLCLYHHQRTAKEPHEPLNISKLPHFFTDLRCASENFADGNWLALLDALAICREHELPVPDWLEKGVRDFVITSVKGFSHGKRGKENSPLAQVKDEWKRQKRAEIFRRIRIVQSYQGEGADLLLALMLPHETKRLLQTGRVASVGTTREDAIQLTFMSLQGTEAQASLATLDRNMTEYLTTISEFDISQELRVELGLDRETDIDPFGLQLFPSVKDALLTASAKPTDQPDA